MWVKKQTFPGAIILIWSLCLSAETSAEGYAITPEERRLLPPICQAGQQRMKSILGPHKLHFCEGFKYIIRANSSMGDRNKELKKLSLSLGEFEYVLSHTKQDNVNGQYNNVLAMTSLEKGKVYNRMGQGIEAMKMFHQAIKYNPKLPQAYAGLSDIYLDLDQAEEAREVLETGLKQAPKSRSLKRRIEKLSKK
jgi:tetratricopeptide (TPR) repeat protein